jgi:hypothetical protein
MGGSVGVIRALVSQDVLLRALRNANMRQELSLAFMLRENERGTGLSVNFDQTPAECQAGFICTYGVASLTVQSVADLQLRVVPDEPHHANITGVPYKEDDPLRAEFLASQLAKQATLASTMKVDNRA